MKWGACSRMYDVTPGVRAHWHALLRAAAGVAGVEIECIDHAAPAALEALWDREDLGAAFMCGLPLATLYTNARTLAAPLTVLAKGAVPSYRSVWLVRALSAFDSLESTFGQRIGWTVAHSHSGCNAPRHALLAQRTPGRPQLYRTSTGPLGAPRAALAALQDERIDVLALDGYWWWLLQRHDAEAAAYFRVIAETANAPMPPLICSAAFAADDAARLTAALAQLHEDPAAQEPLDALGLRAFKPARSADYMPLAAMERAALAAGYPFPA